MKPEVVLLADVRDRIDRVECTEHGRAARAIDEEGTIALLERLAHQALQFGWNHLASVEI